MNLTDAATPATPAPIHDADEAAAAALLAVLRDDARRTIRRIMDTE